MSPTPGTPGRRLVCVHLEDIKLYVIGVQEFLEQEGFEFYAADDPDEFFSLVAKKRPDVVLIDLQLGRTDFEFRGLEVLKKLKQDWKSIKCIVLTSFPTPENTRRALNFGADGFLVKTATDPDALLRAIRTVMNGQKVVDSEAESEVVRQRVDGDGRRLTRAEIRLLTIQKFRDLTHREAANELGIGLETVNTQFDSIFEKLGVHDKRSAVTKAIKLGLI